MTNEELVALIQSGERDKLGELWWQVERFISMRAGKTALALDGYGGVTAEDLYQSGYFALVAAVRDYDPARGCKFLSYLSTHLKTAFAEAGGYRSKKRDWLNYAAGLEDPLPGTDDFAPEDIAEDARAARDFENVEHRVWLEQLSAALDKALEELPPQQRAAIEAHYYQGKLFREIAEERGLSLSRVQQMERKAFRTLQRNKAKNHLADFVEGRTPYYLHVGAHSGLSPVEEIVTRRETLAEEWQQRQGAKSALKRERSKRGR